MPKWLRRTEIGAGIAVGVAGALLGYDKPTTMGAVFSAFLIIEAGWFAYRRRRGIPDA